MYFHVPIQTTELKTAHSHMMPPLLHLSDIRFKCFPCRRCRGKQKAQWKRTKLSMSVV